MNATIQEIEGIDDYWGPAFRSVYEGEGHEAFVQQLDERIVQHDKEIEKLCNFHYQKNPRRKRTRNRPSSSSHIEDNSYDSTSCHEDQERYNISNRHSNARSREVERRRSNDFDNSHSVRSSDRNDNGQDNFNNPPKRRRIDPNRLGGYSNTFPTQGTIQSDSLNSHNLSLVSNEVITKENQQDTSDEISIEEYNEIIKYHTLHHQSSDSISNSPEPSGDLRSVLRNRNQQPDTSATQNLVISVKQCNITNHVTDHTEKRSINLEKSRIDKKQSSSEDKTSLDLRTHLQSKLNVGSVECKQSSYSYNYRRQTQYENIENQHGIKNDRDQILPFSAYNQQRMDHGPFDYERQGKRESNQHLHNRVQRLPSSSHHPVRQIQLPREHSYEPIKSSGYDTDLNQYVSLGKDIDQRKTFSIQLNNKPEHMGKEWESFENRHSSNTEYYECLYDIKENERDKRQETKSHLQDRQEVLRKQERYQKSPEHSQVAHRSKRQYITLENERRRSPSSSTDLGRYTKCSENRDKTRYSPIVYRRAQITAESIEYDHDFQPRNRRERESIEYNRAQRRPGSPQDKYHRRSSSFDNIRKSTFSKFDSRQNRRTYIEQDRYRKTSPRRDNAENDNRQSNSKLSDRTRPSRSSSSDHHSIKRSQNRPTSTKYTENLFTGNNDEHKNGDKQRSQRKYSIVQTGEKSDVYYLDSQSTSRYTSLPTLDDIKYRHSGPPRSIDERELNPEVTDSSHHSRSGTLDRRNQAINNGSKTYNPHIQKQPASVEKTKSDQLNSHLSIQDRAVPLTIVNQPTAVHLPNKPKPIYEGEKKQVLKPYSNGEPRPALVVENSIGKRITSSQFFQSESIDLKQVSDDQADNIDSVTGLQLVESVTSSHEANNSNVHTMISNSSINPGNIQEEKTALKKLKKIFDSKQTSEQNLEENLLRSPQNLSKINEQDHRSSLDSIETVIVDLDQELNNAEQCAIQVSDDKSELRNDYEAVTRDNHQASLRNISLKTDSMDYPTNSEISSLLVNSDLQPTYFSNQDNLSGVLSDVVNAKSSFVSAIKQELNNNTSNVPSDICLERVGHQFVASSTEQMEAVPENVNDSSKHDFFKIAVRDVNSVNSLLTSINSNEVKQATIFEKNGDVEELNKTIEVLPVDGGFWYTPVSITVENLDSQKKTVVNHCDPRLRAHVVNYRQEVLMDTNSSNNVVTNMDLDLLTKCKDIILLSDDENKPTTAADYGNDGSVKLDGPESPEYQEQLVNTQIYDFDDKIAKTIPLFDPANKRQNINEWIAVVDNIAFACKWSDLQVVKYALPRLEGNAKSLFENFGTSSVCWKELQEKLKIAFPSKVNYGKMLSDMLSLKAKAGDSLVDYYYEKKELLDKCSISGDKAIDCVIFGIEDIFVRARLKAHELNNLEDLLTCMRNL